MHTRYSFPTVLFLTIAAAACGSPHSFAQEPPADPARSARLKTLHDAGVTAPIALYPIRVLGRPSTNVADALGLALERMGMAAVEPAGAAFDAGDAAWDAVPTRFGASVRAARRDGAAPRHALYAEFLGDPQQGPTEVRFVVVDGNGEVVLVDRQTPQDRAFQRTAGRDPDPLGCSRLVAERLFELADWQQVPGGIENGRYAQLWRQKAGAPDAAELAAMKQRADALARDLGKARLAVLTPLWHEHDEVDTQRFADALRTELGCLTAAPAAGALEVAPASNQQKRLWDLAKAAQAALKAHPIDADYAVAADMGLAPGGKSGFVNVVVLTHGGDVVVADFQNDQHRSFQAAAPKTLADCERLAARQLRSLLR